MPPWQLSDVPFRLRQPPEAVLRRTLSDQAGRDVTCPAAESVNDLRRRGFRSMRDAVELGSGAEVFAGAVQALLSWEVHRGAGFHVVAEEESVEEGSCVLLVFRFAALYVTVACRVVRQIDEPGRRGFTYSTLPLHPECGRQTFAVERDAAGTVRFVVASISRPRGALARLGRPVTLAEQRRATVRYMSSTRRLASR